MATSSSSSRSPPYREQPPLYRKLSWPARFSERHYSGKRLALNFSRRGGCPALFAKHPFRLQLSDESSGHSQTGHVIVKVSGVSALLSKAPPKNTPVRSVANHHLIIF